VTIAPENIQTQTANTKISRMFGLSAGKILGGKILADGAQTRNERQNTPNGMLASKFDRDKSSADARDRNNNGGASASDMQAKPRDDKALEF